MVNLNSQNKLRPTIYVQNDSVILLKPTRGIITSNLRSIYHVCKQNTKGRVKNNVRVLYTISRLWGAFFLVYLTACKTTTIMLSLCSEAKQIVFWSH